MRSNFRVLGRQVYPGKALFEGRPDTVQPRLFCSEFGGLYCVAMIELRRAVSLATLGVAQFGNAAKYLDLPNVYLPDFRRGVTPSGV